MPESVPAGAIFQPGARHGDDDRPVRTGPPPPTVPYTGGPVRWSYVVALVTCAFIAPVAAIGMEYTWAAERYRVLMAHGGAPSGTEYFVMLVGMMLVMGLAGTFVTVVVALSHRHGPGRLVAWAPHHRRLSSRFATAWFACPVTIMAADAPVAAFPTRTEA